MTTPTVVDALAMWSEWNCEISPLGSTGDYGLDIRLSDAFRAMLYRPVLNDRLRWLEREAKRPATSQRDLRYRAEMIAWWLDVYEAEKFPIIETRRLERCRVLA